LFAFEQQKVSGNIRIHIIYSKLQTLYYAILLDTRILAFYLQMSNTGVLISP